jgi:uncharacterized protein (DUF1778 family)
MSKQFDLKDIEVQMIRMFANQYQVQLSNFLSFIALERLAQTVTDKTQFKLSEDLKTLIIQDQEEEVEPTETAKAVKKK